MCEGRDIPWLQDVEDTDVWATWDVTYRDVIVVDSEGKRFGVFNVTDHNLGEAVHHDALKQLMLDAAE